MPTQSTFQFNIRYLRIMALTVLLGISLWLAWRNQQELIFEASINEHLPNTFRVVADGAEKFATSMPPIAKVLLDSIPEVEAATRTRAGEKVVVSANGQEVFTKNFFYVDNQFFDVFKLSINEEQVRQLMDEPFTVVLSKSFAINLFGKSNVTGDTLLIDNRNYKIVGTVDVNSHSHLDFDFVLSYLSFTPPSFATLQSWGWMTFYNYVRLHEASQENEVELRLPKILRSAGGERVATALKLHLQPIDSIYIGKRFSEDGKNQVMGKIGELKANVYSYLFLSMVFALFLYLQWHKIYFHWAIGVFVIIGFFSFHVHRTLKANNHYVTLLGQLGFNADISVIEFDHLRLKEKFDSLKSDLLRSEKIVSVGAGNHLMEGVSGRYLIYADSVSPNSGKGLQANFYPTHNNFFSTLNIKFTDGDDFSKSNLMADTLWKLIVNQRAADMLAKGASIIGERYFIAGQGGMHGEVVGVVNDFHYQPLTREIEPLICFFRPNATNYLIINGNQDSRLAIEREWFKYFPTTQMQIDKLSERKGFILRSEKYILDSRKEHLLIATLLMIPFILLQFSYKEN